MLFRYFICYCVLEACILNVYGRTDTEIKEWFMQQGFDCNKDYPLTAEEMQVLHKNQMPESKLAKCFMACLFRKTNMMDNKGKFDMDGTHALAKENYPDNLVKLENSKKLIDMCKKVNDQEVSDGENGCDRAHHLFYCLVNSAPQMGFEI